MNKDNSYNELEQQLFNYFENQEPPVSTQNMIRSCLKNNLVNKRKTKLIYKFAIYFISTIIITSGVVFAKDIFNFVVNLFNNTTTGITDAINNGYIQNVNMEFVYENDIGIKIDYLVVDENNLNFSLVYDYSNLTDVKNISIDEFIIMDDNNNCIYSNYNNNELIKYCNDYTRINNQIIEGSDRIRESLLLKSIKFPKFSNLNFEIKSIILNNNEKINGNWVFSIDIDTKLVEYNSINYTILEIPEVCEYIVNLNETSFNIEVLLNTDFNDDIILDPDSIILKNKYGKVFKTLFIKTEHVKTDKGTVGKFYIEFDIGKYSEEIDNLYLYLKIAENKELNITLKK